VRLNVARNVVPGSDGYVQPNYIFLYGAILFYLPQIVGVAVLLPSRWNPKACDFDLQLWLMVQAVRLLFVLAGWIGLYIRFLVDPCIRFDRFVTFFGLIWFVMGNYWFYRASTTPLSACPREAVYSLAQALLICAYFPFVLPVVLVCVSIPVLWCCLPNVIRMMNFYMQRERGADQQLLNSIERVHFQSGMFPNDDALCAICLSNYEQGDDLHAYPCRHHYHVACSEDWLRLNATCPSCRWDLKREDGGRPHPPNQPQPSHEL